MKPTDYTRRILLAVTGLSPQVVTETLYALATSREVRWIPTEIHLITTREGAERVRHSLLNPEHGHFHGLCRDYNLPAIDFTKENVHKVLDHLANPLEDIRSERDNQCCADAITERVRELTADPESSLHVSIAGGRKTMGYYLGYALSLYGREQDRLSHVLVNTPYESHPDFYYPTKKSHLIYTRGDRPRAYEAKEAQVFLAEIPFVRLRDGLPLSLLNGRTSFSQTVSAAQWALGPDELVVDLENRCLLVSGVLIENIPAAELSFYSWMARRCMEKSGPVRYDEVDQDQGIASAFLSEYRSVVGEFSGDYENTEKSLFNKKKGFWNLKQGDFEYRKSRANKVLKQNLPHQLSKRYEITSIVGRPKTRWGLRVPPEAVRYGSAQSGSSE